MKKYAIFTVIKSVKFFTFSLIVCSIFLLAGCWGLLTQSSKLVVINVLDPDDYLDCHITGSVNIPFSQIEERIKTLYKKDSYVLYCSNYACTAAPFAAQMLKSSGFEDVSLFPGGIVQWYQKGYSCTGPAQKDYLKEENEPLSDDELGIKIISAEDLKVALA